ncbi:MAG: cyclic nucleotide-binding domain-containing protein, partial [Alphaproteobacteria bacterium]|nr:cyclic nucleotide-binding domain-containing protein [Alphaproteobacteria bacterium]
MVETVTIQRPRRWDVPFSDTMDEAEVSRILGLEPFRGMDRERFPETLSLDGIIANDTRVVRFQDGDIVMREGDYGNSAFLVITGEVRVVLPPGLPEASESDDASTESRRRRRLVRPTTPSDGSAGGEAEVFARLPRLGSKPPVRIIQPDEVELDQIEVPPAQTLPAREAKEHMRPKRTRAVKTSARQAPDP